MLYSVVQIVEVFILVAILVWVIKLSSRFFRLHAALEEAPAMIAAVIEASDRMEASRTQFKEDMAREGAKIEQQLNGVRRVAGELTNSMRLAEEMQIRLDQSTRAGHRVGAARAAAPAPHLAEPRGLDALPAARRMAGMEPAALPGPARLAPLGFAQGADLGRAPAPILRQEVSVGAAVAVPDREMAVAAPRAPRQEARRETVVVG